MRGSWPVAIAVCVAVAASARTPRLAHGGDDAPAAVAIAGKATVPVARRAAPAVPDAFPPPAVAARTDPFCRPGDAVAAPPPRDHRTPDAPSPSPRSARGPPPG